MTVIGAPKSHIPPKSTSFICSYTDNGPTEEDILVKEVPANTPLAPPAQTNHKVEDKCDKTTTQEDEEDKDQTDWQKIHNLPSSAHKTAQYLGFFSNPFGKSAKRGELPTKQIKRQ